MTPLDMPAHGINAVSLEIEQVDYLSPEAGGRIGGVTAGFPLWRLTAGITNMSYDDADIWIAWRDRLRGVKRPFVAWDASRDYPARYPSGFRRTTTAAGDPFDGAAASWSQAIDDDGNAVLTLTGLPKGFVLSRRDYVGFRWDAEDSDPGTNDRRTMARVVVPAIADGTGEVAVMVEPPVPTLVVPDTAVAHFDRPACIMRQVTGETQMAQIGLGYVAAGSTIVGIQDLRA